MPIVIQDYGKPVKGDELLERFKAISPEAVSALLMEHAALNGIKNVFGDAGIYDFMPWLWSEKCLYSTSFEAFNACGKEKDPGGCKSLGEMAISTENKMYGEHKKTKKNKIILEFMERFPAIDSMIEELSNEVSCSLGSIKSGIEAVRIHQNRVSRDNPQSIAVYIENVDSFYKTASNVINSLILKFRKNIIRCIAESDKNDDFEKLLLMMASQREKPLSNVDEAIKAERLSLNKIAAWEGEEILLFNPDEILFFSKEDNVTVAVTRKGKYKVRDGLELLEKKLSGKSFFRCHRSFLVNLNCITRIVPWIGQNSHILKIEGLSYEIPISRSRIREMKKILGI